LDCQGCINLPGNVELIAQGMTAPDPVGPSVLAFELESHPAFEALSGRLVVAWPKPDQAWSRWAANSAFLITALGEDSWFEQAMPSWDRLQLSWGQLQTMPRSWRSALAQWRGIYYIFDAERRAGYVGSAGGVENILGRWQTYAASGHGGNRQLRESRPAALSFSILERTSPDMDLNELVAREQSWKSRLQTRAYGLKEN
jgi:hypothetical protein